MVPVDTDSCWVTVIAVCLWFAVGWVVVVGSVWAVLVVVLFDLLG